MLFVLFKAIFWLVIFVIIYKTLDSFLERYGF